MHDHSSYPCIDMHWAVAQGGTWQAGFLTKPGTDRPHPGSDGATAAEFKAKAHTEALTLPPLPRSRPKPASRL
eukprot:365683-Chlamydomonas_euryale.AAC.6